MKKRKKNRKFHRPASQRKALIISLMSALFLEGKIKSTLARCKEIKGLVDKMINKAKTGDFNAYRYLNRYFHPKVSQKIIREIALKYKDKNSGYTRIIKLGPRKSDSAEMGIIELT